MHWQFIVESQTCCACGDAPHLGTDNSISTLPEENQAENGTDEGTHLFLKIGKFACGQQARSSHCGKNVSSTAQHQAGVLALTATDQSLHGLSHGGCVVFEASATLVSGVSCTTLAAPLGCDTSRTSEWQPACFSCPRSDGEPTALVSTPMQSCCEASSPNWCCRDLPDQATQEIVPLRGARLHTICLRQYTSLLKTGNDDSLMREMRPLTWLQAVSNQQQSGMVVRPLWA